jgi:hypothetical protein
VSEIWRESDPNVEALLACDPANPTLFKKRSNKVNFTIPDHGTCTKGKAATPT